MVQPDRDLGIASIVIASVYLLDIRPKIAEILSGQ